MTHAQLIAAMIAAAEPVVKAYFSDLTHDTNTIAQAECGDVFLWAPYESGTRLVCLWRGDKPNKRAAELFAAMNAMEDAQWYRVVIGLEDTFGLDAVTDEAARDEAQAATATAADPGRESVSQMHM